MAFLPGLDNVASSFGSGFSSLLDSVTGKTKETNIQNANSAQQQFEQSYIDSLNKENALKYNPVLVAEKNKQILMVVGGIIVVIVLLKVFKVF